MWWSHHYPIIFNGEHMFYPTILRGCACILLMLSMASGNVRAAEEAAADTTAQSAAVNGSETATDANTMSYMMPGGIEVVGDKVGRDIQDLPTSTAVINESRIKNEPIANIDDVLNRVANVTSEGLAAYGGAYSIRGINSTSLVGTYAIYNLLSTTFINQVPLSVLMSDFIRPSTWDIRSVEVLRGPQSALQGPNSMVGAVFFNYNRPDFSTDGGFQAEYGELDTWNLSLYQNIPLSEDYLAARISLETRNSDGGIISTVTGDDDVANIEQRFARLQFLYQPAGNDDITFNMTGIYKKSESNAFGRAQEFDGNELKDRLNNESHPGDWPAEGWIFALESDIRLDDNWRFAAVTGYTDTKIGQSTYDGDLSDLVPPDGMTVNSTAQQLMFTQDLRLHYKSERFRGLIGGYYSDTESSDNFDFIGRFSPPFPYQVGGFSLTEDVVTKALYANADYDILDNLTLNAGLRYNYEERGNSNYSKIVFYFDPEGAPFMTNVGEDSGTGEYYRLLPSASLTVKITDDVSAGVKFAQGYRSGGIAVAPFVQKALSYDEEYSNNYELFLRTAFLDGRLTLNGNVFLIDWRDQQIPFTPAGGTPGFDVHFANAGKSEIMGFEVEATAEVTDDLEAFLALGYTHSEFKEFMYPTFDALGNPIEFDLSGRPLPNSPEWTVSVGANYEHRSGFFAGGSFRWVDESYAEINKEEVTKLSFRNILDARMGYREGNSSVYAWGTNLLDDFYIAHTGTYNGLNGVGRYAKVSTPRRLGVGFEATW